MKRWVICCLMGFLLLCLSGCSGKDGDAEKKIELEYSVVSEDEIPEALKNMIQEKKESAFHFTYTEGGLLYFTEGYGKQSTGGYSIQVKEVYKQGNAIYCQTTLKGPSSRDEIIKAESYPYIVFVTKYTPEPTIFK